MDFTWIRIFESIVSKGRGAAEDWKADDAARTVDSSCATRPFLIEKRSVSAGEFGYEPLYRLVSKNSGNRYRCADIQVPFQA